MSEHNNAGTPLSRKLLMLGALPAIVMFITLIGFFTSTRLEDARRDLSDSNQLLADSLAPSLEYAVVSGNKMALQEILTKSIRYSKADWIRVTDVTGAQIGRAARGSTQDILWTSVALGITLLLFTILVISHSLKAILLPIRQVSGRINRLIEKDYGIARVNIRSNHREVIAIEQQLNELAEHLDALYTSSDIINDSRLDSSSVIMLEHQVFNLRTFITNSVAPYRHAAEQQRLALTLDFYGDWPEMPLELASAEDFGTFRSS